MGFSFKCFDEYKQKAGNLCDWYNYDQRGAVCGQEGNYQLDYSLTLPSEIDEINETGFDSWGLPIDVMVEASLGGLCEVDSSQDTDAVYASAAGVVILAGVAGILQRRRRRIATTSDDKAHAFVEMADTNDAVV